MRLENLTVERQELTMQTVRALNAGFHAHAAFPLMSACGRIADARRLLAEAALRKHVVSHSEQRVEQRKLLGARACRGHDALVRRSTGLEAGTAGFPCLARCVAPRTVESFAHHNFAAIRGRSKLLDEAVLRVGNQCVRNPQRTVIHKDSRLEKRLASA